MQSLSAQFPEFRAAHFPVPYPMVVWYTPPALHLTQLRCTLMSSAYVLQVEAYMCTSFSTNPPLELRILPLSVSVPYYSMSTCCLVLYIPSSWNTCHALLGIRTCCQQMAGHISRVFFNSAYISKVFIIQVGPGFAGSACLSDHVP